MLRYITGAGRKDDIRAADCETGAGSYLISCGMTGEEIRALKEKLTAKDTCTSSGLISDRTVKIYPARYEIPETVLGAVAVDPLLDGIIGRVFEQEDFQSGLFGL